MMTTKPITVQMRIDERLGEGPTVGDVIEYNVGLYRPRWVRAIVVERHVLGGNLAMEVMHVGYGGDRTTSGCYVEHEGRTWRYPIGEVDRYGA